MNNLKRISIETFVILLATLVLDIQAGCTWDKSSETSCTIECSADYDFSGTETLEEVLADLEIKWQMRQNCHAEGIFLTLSASLDYPSYIVKANWFTAQVKVKELKIYTSNVGSFEANAFNSTALKSVKTLTFPSMSLDLINKGIFNGLESLEVLVMESAALKTIEDGVLDALNGTLQKIILIESSRFSSELRIDGFTGSEPMRELEEVKFNYNLKTTITHTSFVGLQNVKILDLSNCQIVTIGAGAFDLIGSSIRELNLKDNAITTLPDGLFNFMLPNEVTAILLEGNKWDCECHLMPFKMTLIEHSNFVGSVKCNTPSYRRDLSVITTNFCDSYVPPSTQPTTQSTTTTTTTTTISTTTIDNSSPTVPPIPEEYSQKCYEPGESESSEIISIKTPSARLKVNENEYGEVLVEVDTLSENFVLLWFSELDQETYYTASDEISCAIGSKNSVPINNLKQDTVYTFCLMDSTEKTVSPLDCRSYTKQLNLEQPWLLNSNKSFIISMTAVACSISLLIGLALGALVLKINHTLKANGNDQHNRNATCINEVLKETFQSNSIMRQQNRMSNTTADSFGTKRTTNLTIDYYFDHSDKAPPLPARSYSMDPFDEPIYAVVENVRDK